MNRSPKAPPPEPFLLPLAARQLFCIRYSPPCAARGAILFVPAFAEELNKSRRTVALQARAFAGAGFTVVVPDLYGCGDSEGSFAEADWQVWRDDVRAIAAWLRADTGYRPMLWALRAGCLLACEAMRDAEVAGDAVWWQPVVSGRQALQQFLRLRVMQQALDETSSRRITTQDLRDALLRGDTIEVAGYPLPPAVALGLDKAELSGPVEGRRVAWFEVATDDGATASPAVVARVDAWRGAGAAVTLHVVGGEAFWQTQEIVECLPLVSATSAAVAQWPKA